VHQYRDDVQLPELEHQLGNVPAEVGQVVLVALADLLDEFVDAQPLEQVTHLGGSLVWQPLLQRFVRETRDGALAVQQEPEQGSVLLAEEIETLVTVVLGHLRLGQAERYAELQR
jgi:hypothetical protein